MRVDSTGIYNSRGLVQNRPKNLIPQRNTEVNKAQATGKADKPQKFVLPKLAENLNQLSSAELNQINKLFGQVDLSSLNTTDKAKLDDRPGQIIDIVV